MSPVVGPRNLVTTWVGWRFNAEFSADNERLRSRIYLNCWCMSQHESTALWEIYAGREPQGVAIRSRYERLSESITDPRLVFIGRVKYIDFEAEAIADFGGFSPFVHKRVSFDFEREIRAVYYLAPPDDGPEGIQISVDLDRLIEEVYPTEPLGDRKPQQTSVIAVSPLGARLFRHVRRS
jgi:hypothetical protein